MVNCLKYVGYGIDDNYRTDKVQTAEQKVQKVRELLAEDAHMQRRASLEDCE